jgi:hypothetical protein
MEITILNWKELRLIISILGEYHQWWSANVISSKGKEFLDYVLPKTKLSAVHQLATEIGRQEHDKHVSAGRYHIFRLTQKLEENIFHELKKNDETLDQLDQNQALQILREMASGISINASKGPVLIGTHEELNDKSLFQSIARHYYEAFANNYKTYPYLN